jgi:hypothetical protein
MDDGIVLPADVCRPIGEGHIPVILSYGGYGKDLSYREDYPMVCKKKSIRNHPLRLRLTRSTATGTHKKFVKGFTESEEGRPLLFGRHLSLLHPSGSIPNRSLRNAMASSLVLISPSTCFWRIRLRISPTLGPAL